MLAARAASLRSFPPAARPRRACFGTRRLQRRARRRAADRRCPARGEPRSFRTPTRPQQAEAPGGAALPQAGACRSTECLSRASSVTGVAAALRRARWAGRPVLLRMPARAAERLRLTVSPGCRRGLRSRRSHDGGGDRWSRIGRDRPNSGAPGHRPAAGGARGGLGRKNDRLRPQRRRWSGRRAHRRLQRGDHRAGDEIRYRTDGKRPQRSAPCGEKEQRQSNRGRGEPDRDC